MVLFARRVHASYNRDMESYSEYLGVGTKVYSVFHCDLYTISIVQDGQGELLEVSCETDLPVGVSPKEFDPFEE